MWLVWGTKPIDVDQAGERRGRESRESKQAAQQKGNGKGSKTVAVLGEVLERRYSSAPMFAGPIGFSTC